MIENLNSKKDTSCCEFVFLNKKTISYKEYKENKGLRRSRGVRVGYGVGVWKVISRWEGFKNRMVFRIGNRQRIKSWENGWCGDEPLGEAFPTLFSIASTKDAWIAEG